MFHYSVDGDIIMRETPEANDQQDMLENKQRQEKNLLHSINASIIQQFGKDPLDDDKNAQKRSLRNQFNYQERASQTFNLPIREKGMKTNPP